VGLPERVALRLGVLEGVGVGVTAPLLVPVGVGVEVLVWLALSLGVVLALPVLEGEAPLVREAVGEALTVELPERVLLGVAGEVLVGEPVGEPVGVGVGLCELEGLPVWEALPVMEGETPLVREAEGEVLTVVLPDWVLLGVSDAVPVPVGVGLPVLVAVADLEAVVLPVGLLLPLLEGEAPAVREAVGDPETVLLLDRVLVGEREAVPVPVPEPVGVGVGEGVRDGVPVLESELLPLLEGEAPAVREAVDEPETVLLLDRVLVGEREAVPVPVPEPVGVGVGEGVRDGVPVLESELLPLLEGEAPAVREAVGDPETVLLEEREVVDETESVPDAEPVPVVGWGLGVGQSLGGDTLLEMGGALAAPVLLLVPETDTVGEPVAVLLSDTVPEAVPEAVSEAVPEAEAPIVTEEVGVGVSEAVLLLVRVSLPVAVGDAEGLSVALPDWLVEEEGVGVVVAVVEADVVGVAVAEADVVGVAVTEAEVVGVAAAVPVPVPVPEAEAPIVTEEVGVGVSEEVLLLVRVPLPVAVGDAEPLAVPLSVWVQERVGVGVGEAEVEAVAGEDALAVTEAVTVAVTVAVGEALVDPVAVPVALTVADGVGDELGVEVAVAQAVVEEEALAVAVMVGEVEGVGAARGAEGEAVPVGVAAWLEDCVGVADGEGGREGVVEAVGVTEGVGVLEGVAEAAGQEKRRMAEGLGAVVSVLMSSARGEEESSSKPLGMFSCAVPTGPRVAPAVPVPTTVLVPPSARPPAPALTLTALTVCPLDSATYSSPAASSRPRCQGSEKRAALPTPLALPA
jgi:hypothetical protein